MKRIPALIAAAAVVLASSIPPATAVTAIRVEPRHQAGESMSSPAVDTPLLVASIPVGERPLTPVLDTVANQVVVADSDSGVVSFIDASTFTLRGTLSVAKKLDGIEDLAIDSASHRLFALVPYAHELVVVDTVAMRVVKRVPFTASLSTMALDERNKKLYVLTEKPYRLVAVDTRSGAVQRSVRAPQGSNLLAFDSVNRIAYTDSWENNRGGLVAVQPSTGRVLWRLRGIDDIGGIVPDPGARRVYLPLSDDEDPGSLVVVDTRTHRIMSNVSVGMWPGFPVPCGACGSVYLSTANQRFVTVIKAKDCAVTGRIETDGEPSMPVLNESESTLYISSSSRRGGEVLIVDPVSNTVTARAAVGKSPGVPVLSPDETHLYVADSDAGNLDVVSLPQG